METLTVHKVRSVRPVGTRAVLAELSGTQDVLALQTLLLESPLPGQQDVLAASLVTITGLALGRDPQPEEDLRLLGEATGQESRA